MYDEIVATAAVFDDVPLAQLGEHEELLEKLKRTGPEPPMHPQEYVIGQLSRNRSRYPNMYKLFLSCMMIICSTACNERAFSVRTAIKTVRRSRLSAHNLNAAMHVCLNTSRKLADFDFARCLHKWKESAEYRHIYTDIAAKIVNLQLNTRKN